MARKKSKTNTKQMSILEVLEQSKLARETIQAMLSAKQAKDSWRGLVATPPGSFLEAVVNAFYQATDIPLELPFFAAMTLVSSELLQKGVKVDFAGQQVRPDLWLVLLAESGAGKTFAVNRLEEITGKENEFPECASSAAFVIALQDHNRKLWIRDEFGQWLKMLEQQPHMAEIKDYLLRVYDGKSIERTTKKDSIVVDDPALVILGMAVLGTFNRYITGYNPTKVEKVS